ncbi:MAG: TIGR00730 family Rossman fold protein [Chitinophagales bacterium]|nr:TIGR00730 family Rossman fold protein [Chitinophagales bacterium]
MAFPINSIAVFCGSRKGSLPEYSDAAQQLGEFLANNEITLVYGGSKTGLMGILASTVLLNDGEAIGIMPEFMVGHEKIQPGLTDMIIVDTLQERKLKMERFSDCSISLPGGFGTMDELFEMLTWSQLNLHKKPIGLWNVHNYYDDLLSFLDNMIHKEFLLPQTRELLITSSDLEELVNEIGSRLKT